MIYKGNRQLGNPYFINQGNTTKLERISLNDNLFQESWLQQLVHNNPKILPVDEIESGFSPLIPLGREIKTEVGFVDNLFISPSGYLTIVETKLWRNNEAKREVVAQIIDYAKEFIKWDFEKLDRSVKKVNNNEKGIFEKIEEYDYFEEDNRMKLVSEIEKNLKRGRILLLIVGDGIQTNVEYMADYLQNFAQLQFTLGLVELQLFKMPNNANEIFVLPSTLIRTIEITRAIIKIENNSNTKVDIRTDFKEEKTKFNYLRTSLTEEDFYNQLLQNTNNKEVEIAKKLILKAKELELILDWQANGVTVKYEPIKGETKIFIFRITRMGEFSLGKWEKDDSFNILNINQDSSIEYKNNTGKMLGASTNKYRHKWDKSVSLIILDTKIDNYFEEVKTFIGKIDEELKKANG
jgi:hypothetical protein